MQYGSIQAPAGDAVEITPNDSTRVHYTAIYVGGTGDLKVTTEGENDVTFKSVQVGTILPVRVTRVFTTGTTATNLVGLTP